MSADGCAFVSPTAQPSGLVSISTTQTRNDSPAVFVVDADEARLRKMKRRVCKAAEVHEAAMKGVTGYAPAMVTLTYQNQNDWHPNHLRNALTPVRQWLKRRGHGMRYVWVAELQDRGAIHYHVVVYFPCKEWGNGVRKVADTPPFWDVQGWWKHGHSQSAWADNPIGYIASYVSKINSKDRLPCGARMHGSGGFDLNERAAMAYHSRPTWVRNLSQIGQRITRPVGGGIAKHFVCGLVQRVASPFILLMRGGGRVVIARRDVPADTVRSFLGDLWLPTPIPA